MLSDDDIERLENCPCVACEQCNWRAFDDRQVQAYCRLHFEIVYPSVTQGVVVECLEHDLGLIKNG